MRQWTCRSPELDPPGTTAVGSGGRVDGVGSIDAVRLLSVVLTAGPLVSVAGLVLAGHPVLRILLVGTAPALVTFHAMRGWLRDGRAAFVVTATFSMLAVFGGLAWRTAAEPAWNLWTQGPFAYPHMDTEDRPAWMVDPTVG